MSTGQNALKEKGYAAYWALSGIARPMTMAAFLRDRREADRLWSDIHPKRIEDLGTVSRLSILPLIDYSTRDDRLTPEPGVSYLVTCDDTRLLFDVGRNVHEEHPSPLLRNMDALGISPADLHALFISHIHLDHVGGIGNQHQKTFSLSARPTDLRGIPAYVPAPMTHPSAQVEVMTGPKKLGEGVVTTGPLMRALWLMGPAYEHALLVNVKDRGLVMIVGCGHPSLTRLLERAAAVSDVPLYGIVGGLHFPVTGSRVGKGGQNIIGNGKFPWQRITKGEAREAARRLATLDLGLVALSTHDSCDWTLGVFRDTLGDGYRQVWVGEEIVIA